MRPVLTESAEQAQALIMRGLAHYREVTAPFDVRIQWSQALRGRHRIRLGRRARLASHLPEHDALLRIVAIAEDFSLVRLVDLTEDLLPPGRLTSALWTTEQQASLETWPRRMDAWKRLHGIRI